jgi:hypothetical protein
VKSIHTEIPDPEAYQRREERRDRLKVALEVLTLLAVIIYAALTFRLLKTGQTQVDAMNAANLIAKQNLHADLRAYVSLGDTNGQWINRNQHKVTLFFHNAGRTSAKNFSVRYTVGQAGAQQSAHMDIIHIERTQIVSGLGAGGIIEGGGSEIDSGETLEWPDSKPDVDFEKEWTINGYFEFCDIFGQWHCQPFSGHYEEKVGLERLDLPNIPLCDPNGSTYIASVRKERGPEEAKRYKALNRCERSD